MAQILARLAQLRDELHAIAMARAQDRAQEIPLEEAVRALPEIRAACFKALGRKP